MKSFLLLLSSVTLALAQGLVPTAPGPHETFNIGAPCVIRWNVATGSWMNFTIDLMSGSNNDMSFVANVASGLDGTDPSLSPYSWTCPDVNPYSSIYFYQFTDGGDRVWTTRFTIASPAGETSSPENSKQPNGDSVPWGVGILNSDASSDSEEKDNQSSGETVGDAVDTDSDEEDIKTDKKHKDKSVKDVEESRTEATSSRMQRRPKPTATSSSVGAEGVNPTPSLLPPCPSSGVSTSSNPCTNVDLANEASYLEEPTKTLNLSLVLLFWICTF